MHFKKRSIAIIAAMMGVMLIGGVAWAYWAAGGTGSGTAATASNPAQSIVVTQNAVAALAPGQSVALAGVISNPNSTDIKVGTLTGVIAGVSAGAVGDFSISGSPVVVNAVVKKGTPLAWSGMTLVYANSALNQENAKGATVSITYTLSPFTEPPAGPSAGTLTYTNKTLVIEHVGLWPYVGGSLVVQAGDKLVVPSCDWSGCHGDAAVTTAGAGNEFNFASAGGFYVLDPKNIELVRGTTRYAHSPVILIG